MNAIAIDEKTMTTRELAEALGVSTDTVTRTANSLIDPSSILRRVINGGTSNVFTESQATLIKQQIQKHHNIPSRKIDSVLTQLEKNETIIKAMMYLQQDNESLKTRAETAEQQLIEQAPKVDFADSVMGSKDTVDVKEACKVLNLGIGRNRLFQFLRDESILDRNNQPYQRYIDSGYFRVIESRYLLASGEIKISLKTVVFQRGLNFIRARYAQREKEAS